MVSLVVKEVNQNLRIRENSFHQNAYLADFLSLKDINQSDKGLKN